LSSTSGTVLQSCIVHTYPYVHLVKICLRLCTCQVVDKATRSTIPAPPSTCSILLLQLPCCIPPATPLWQRRILCTVPRRFCLTVQGLLRGRLQVASMGGVAAVTWRLLPAAAAHRTCRECTEGFLTPVMCLCACKRIRTLRFVLHGPRH
jgi:hypothetical protein